MIKLTPREKQVNDLLKEYNLEQIAKILEISVHNVRVLKSRIKRNHYLNNKDKDGLHK